MTKISLKKIRNAIIIGTFILAAGFAGFRLGEGKRVTNFGSVSAKADLSLFWYVWSTLEEKYINKKAIDPNKMVYGAISGMVSSLGDPYTSFFTPEENKVNKENLTGEFGGVGIQLGYKNDSLAVIAPLDNTPASRAGIKAGDLIVRIQDFSNKVDVDTAGIALPEAVKLIRGKNGSGVTLTLFREGTDHTFDVELKRENITIPSVTSEWIEVNGKRVAYVHLLQFTEVMYDQWNRWVEEVNKEKDKSDFGGVILDLRNNPGGFLDGAVYVASEFLEGGVVVDQEYSSGQKDTYRVNRPGKLLNVPLVVLVNRGSASAAEILAGALQHYKRGQVIGEKTFGKGTVQEPETLPGGAGLHVTISRWLLPSGKTIDKEGITPDLSVTIDESVNNSSDLILDKGKEMILQKKN